MAARNIPVRGIPHDQAELLEQLAKRGITKNGVMLRALDYFFQSEEGQVYRRMVDSTKRISHGEQDEESSTQTNR